MPRRAYVIERVKPGGESSVPPRYFHAKVYGQWQYTDGDSAKLKTYPTPAAAFEVVYEMHEDDMRLSRVRSVMVPE